MHCISNNSCLSLSTQHASNACFGFCLRLSSLHYTSSVCIVSCFHLHFHSFGKKNNFFVSKYLEFANREVTFEEISEPSRHQKCSQVLIGKRLMWSCAILLQYHIILEHFAPASNFVQKKKKITLNSRCPN